MINFNSLLHRKLDSSRQREEELFHHKETFSHQEAQEGEPKEISRDSLKITLQPFLNPWIVCGSSLALTERVNWIRVTPSYFWQRSAKSLMVIELKTTMNPSSMSYLRNLMRTKMEASRNARCPNS